MTHDTASDPSSKGPKTRRPEGPATALDRRKAALKANMARRKGQAQARAALSGADDADSQSAREEQ